MADDLTHAPLVIALPPGDGAVKVRDALDHQRLLLVTAGADDAAARELLGREHYFRTWDAALAHGDRLIDRRFERCADAIVAGDLAALERELAANPALATARSAYGHRQTLLHHVAGNGVEWARQVSTPANISDIARALLAAGAEPDATCASYGGRDTVLTLVCSSCHPAEAGLQGALVETLVTGGARVDGPANDSDPLWTAITWGYQDAVDALVRAGARIDNLVLAAAAGDVAATRRFLAASRTTLALGTTGKQLPAEHLLEYALIYAAGLDRRDVVAELLTHGPDRSVREPLFGATALGIASHSHPSAGRPDGNPAIVALLAGHE